MSIFIESFKDYGINHGGIFLFSPDIALSIIEEAQKTKIKILGLDAFLLRYRFIQPWMEHSVNLEKRSDGGWDTAKNFLLEKKKLGFLFEIVVDDDSFTTQKVECPID